MSNKYINKIITNVHPSLGDKIYTYGDIIKISSITGINPQHLFGFLQGIIYPHPIMKKKLEDYFGKDTVNSILKDFDNKNNLEIVSNKDVQSAQRINVIKCPASMLEKNDLVKTEDSYWIKVSSIRRTKKTILVFSNENIAFSCSYDDYVITIKGKSEIKGTITHPENNYNVNQIDREKLFLSLKEKYM